MIKVLHIIQQHGSGRGGVRTFILTMLGCDAPDIEQSVLSVGRVEGDRFATHFYGPLIDDYNPLIVGTVGTRRLAGFLAEHHFDIVQIHTNNGLGFVFAHIARSAGVPVRIVHCHNSALGSSSRLKDRANRLLIKKYLGEATACWACSEVAGDYLFMGKNFTMVHNGVDTDKFRYNSADRDAIRMRLGISSDANVVGFIGAGIPAKNTMRALEVFKEFRSSNPNSALVLLGKGVEFSQAIARASELELEDSVVFTGPVDDIWKYYSAMDVLLAPSHYEGLPIAFVEAQANGLPILSSDAVSLEVDLTGLVQRAGLSLSNQDWSHLLEINALKRKATSANDYASMLDAAGYTTRFLHEQVTSAYRELIKGA